MYNLRICYTYLCGAIVQTNSIAELPTPELSKPGHNAYLSV